jgi:hypothetical protein
MKKKIPIKACYAIACTIEDPLIDDERGEFFLKFHTKDYDKVLILLRCISDTAREHLVILDENGELDGKNNV